jgi:hypothetical protein
MNIETRIVLHTAPSVCPTGGPLAYCFLDVSVRQNRLFNRIGFSP